MLEIIVLIFLCKQMGRVAERKGLRPGQWKLYTVLAWIFAEIAGLIVGIYLFGFDKNNAMGLFLFALASAFGGYLIVKSILDKRPDAVEDDINNIGIND